VLHKGPVLLWIINSFYLPGDNWKPLFFYRKKVSWILPKRVNSSQRKIVFVTSFLGYLFSNFPLPEPFPSPPPGGKMRDSGNIWGRLSLMQFACVSIDPKSYVLSEHREVNPPNINFLAIPTQTQTISGQPSILSIVCCHLFSIRPVFLTWMVK